MSLRCTVSELNGDFSRKLKIIPTPGVFKAPLKGFPLELGTDARGQKLERWGYHLSDGQKVLR